VGAAILQMLPPAVAIAAVPTGPVVAILMLSSPRGRINGPLFALGWFLALASITLVVALTSSGLGTSDDDAPSTWLAVLLLALGVLLLILSAKRWMARPRPDDPPKPRPGWMLALDRATPIKALVTGVTLAGVNPKNIVLIIAAEAAIAQTEISTNAQIAVLALFVVLSSLGAAAPVVISLTLGERARAQLARFSDWMVANTNAILAVVLLVFGVILIADATSAFTA
jgi:threonine/homoserine/homoserine lactone efflux protein